jgi:hypothetical protein
MLSYRGINMSNFPNGTLVTVDINHRDIKFKGKVVGKATTDITESHIVECIDGYIPNETYPYAVCVMPKAALTRTPYDYQHTVVEA